MKPQTAQWVRKAEEDLEAARVAAARTPPLRNVACFHCQQAGEKYFKGLLQERGTVIPKTHDLERLVDLLLPTDPPLRPLRPVGHRLTRYAVDFRYPGEWANRRQARSALTAAERIRAEVRRRLGLRPRP